MVDQSSPVRGREPIAHLLRVLRQRCLKSQFFCFRVMERCHEVPEPETTSYINQLMISNDVELQRRTVGRVNGGVGVMNEASLSEMHPPTHHLKPCKP